MTIHKKTLLYAMAALLLLGGTVGVALVRDGDSPRSTSTETVLAAREGGATQGKGGRGKRPMLEVVRGPGEHALAGTVRGADGAPIGQVSVTAIMELGPGIRGGAPPDAGTLGSAAIVASSDSQGRFVLEGLLAGRYHLRVESNEILSAELRFVEAPGDDLQLLVSRSVVVRGQVTMASAPAAGVMVYLQSEGAAHRHEYRSDAHGAFVFTEIPEGRFQLFAVDVDRAAPVQTLLRLGSGPFSDVELILQKAHAVRGRVVEAGASKLGLAAEILLRHADGIEGEHTTRSAIDGSFSIDGVLPGRWIAEARAPGYLPSAAQSFASESQRALTLTLEAGASVSGVVLGPHRSPIQGALLVLRGRATDGRARIYSQATVVRDVAASLPPGQRLLASGELGVLLGPIPMPPPRGGVRVASIVKARGEESATEQPLSSRRSVFVSDERGRFRISGVEAGEYRLLVSHGVWADGGTESFVVRPGQDIQGKGIKLQAGTRLAGQVADGRGLPIVGASVMVQFADGREPVLAVSEAEGRFAFAAMSGTVDLVVEAVGYERASRRLRLAAGSLTAVDKRIQLRLARADAYIEARLVDATGFSIRGARVGLEPGPGALPSRSRISDDNGLFRIDGLPKGEHWLLVTHSDYPTHRVQLATGVRGELLVPFGGGLQLALRDRQTQSPMSMVDVQLEAVPEKTNRENGRPGKTGVERGVSDQAGKLQFLPLRSGRYQLRAQKTGYAPMSQTLELKAGQRIGELTKDLLLELVRGATIAGIVRDTRGERLVGATVSVGLASTRSDQEGRFRLTDVPSGVISVRIEKAGHGAEQELTLDAGEERVTLELVLASSGQAQSGSSDEE